METNSITTQKNIADEIAEIKSQLPDAMNNSEKQKQLVQEAFDIAKEVNHKVEYALAGCEDCEKRLSELDEVFKTLGQKTGELFVKKSRGILYEKKGDEEKNIATKTEWYERAHSQFNELVSLSKASGKITPSHLKHQAVIKQKLADVLHQSGNHYEANMLQQHSGEIFYKLQREHPDYAKGWMAWGEAEVNAIRWNVQKCLSRLRKARGNFKEGKNRTKYNEEEVRNDIGKINQVSDFLESIIAMYRQNGSSVTPQVSIPV